MKLVNFLYNIDHYNKHQFDIPIADQIVYMSSLGFPKDDIDRSYKQFLCQEFFSPLWIRSFWFIISIVSIIPIISIYWIKGSKIKFEENVDTIAEDKGMEEIIPIELSTKYHINHKAWNAGVGLSSSDIKYLCSKVFGWRQPYFVLKTIMQVATFSPIITKYQPKRLICHSEFSFCSSVITHYCNTRGVKLINVQHGEKLRYIRDAFFRFDECFVWDKHYVEMLKELKAEPSQFKIAVPPSLKIDNEKYHKDSSFANYKYYLASDSEEELCSIVNSLSFAKAEGKTVKYRIHPRYTDINILRKYVSENEIEYPKEVSIQESIANLDYAIGSYTTVLLQAYLSGKKILLDDVTYEARYNQLNEYGYILAKDNIEKLSSKQ